MVFDRDYSKQYSALVFDLDDTLLDTRGQLVTPANREACQAMVDAGLNADLSTCLETRSRLFRERPREDVFSLVVDVLGVKPGCDPERVALAGHDAFFHREVEPHITIDPSVYEMLRAFGESFDLHLVTSGSRKTQQMKIDILGLEPYFSSVHLVETSADKGDAFSSIMRESGHRADKILCIGDRLDREIKAGNQLGMKTCHVRYGEYDHLEPTCPEEEADIRITDILHLAQYLVESA